MYRETLEFFIGFMVFGHFVFIVAKKIKLGEDRIYFFCHFIPTIGSSLKGNLATIYIYFWVRFGMANAINDYQRLKIHVACVGKF